MLTAQVVIQTQPGRAASVQERLGRIVGLSPLRLDGDDRLAGLLRVPEFDTVEGLQEALMAMDGDIVAVYPAFLAVEFES